MKKSLVVLPMLTLLLGCAGEGTKTEANLLENKEELQTFFETVDTVNKAQIDNHVTHVNGKVSGTTISVDLNAKSLKVSDTIPQEDYKLNFAIKNLGFSSKTALTGYKTKAGEVEKNKELKFFTEVNGLNANLALDYKLPKVQSSKKAAVKLAEDSEDDSSVFDLENYIESEGKVNASLSNVKAGVYLDNLNLYVDASNEGIYTFADKILNSGIITLFPKQEEKYSSKMYLGQLFKGYTGKFVIPEVKKDKERTLEYYETIFMFDISKEDIEKDYKKIASEVSELVDTLGFTAYVYGKDSKYAISFESNLNDKDINGVVDVMFDGGFNLLDKMKNIGIKFEKTNNKLSVRFGKTGFIDLSLKLDTKLSLDLNKELIVDYGMESVKGEIVLKTNVNYRVSFDEKYEKTPDFKDYLPLDLSSIAKK